MAGFIPAIHFPEAAQGIARPLWKMDGRHEDGHDD
jgi:hypothetical protein